MLAASRNSINGISRLTPAHQVHLLSFLFLLIGAQRSGNLIRHAGTWTAASHGPCWHA
jgi:hypothetical protein